MYFMQKIAASSHGFCMFFLEFEEHPKFWFDQFDIVFCQKQASVTVTSSKPMNFLKFGGPKDMKKTLWAKAALSRFRNFLKSEYPHIIHVPRIVHSKSCILGTDQWTHHPTLSAAGRLAACLIGVSLYECSNPQRSKELEIWSGWWLSYPS